MAKAKKVVTVAAGLNLALLAAIVASVQSGQQGYLFVTDADAAPLIAHNPPLIEQNPSMVDGSGSKATRPTDAGIQFSAANPPAAAAAPATVAPAAEKPKFNLVKGVPVPIVKRGGGNVGSSIYPFDTMEVDTSFFVPSTPEREDPAKALGSTVSSAMRRFSVPEVVNGVEVMETVEVKGQSVTRKKMIPTRKFTIRAVADGAPWGSPGVAGAAIFREA